MVRYVSAGEIERRVSALWAKHQLESGFDVEWLVDLLDLGLVWLPIPRSNGMVVAAELLPTTRKICVNEALRNLFESNPELLRFTLAHEIGHWIMHSALILAGALDEDRAVIGALGCRTSDLRNGNGRLSDSMRLEFQANLFASHLLAPSPNLRESVARNGCDGWQPIYRIAKELAISPTAVLVRLEIEGVAHRDESGVPRSGPQVTREQVALGF
jgi:hypothetical protein